MILKPVTEFAIRHQDYEKLYDLQLTRVNDQLYLFIDSKFVDRSLTVFIHTGKANGLMYFARLGFIPGAGSIHFDVSPPIATVSQ